jgi:hypothetical protein
MLLLVDDRDGRVVAELETQEEAWRCIETMAREDGGIPDYICLVEFHSQPGAILGADSTVKIRPLLKF